MKQVETTWSTGMEGLSRKWVKLVQLDTNPSTRFVKPLGASMGSPTWELTLAYGMCSEFF